MRWISHPHSVVGLGAHPVVQVAAATRQERHHRNVGVDDRRLVIVPALHQQQRDLQRQHVVHHGVPPEPGPASVGLAHECVFQAKRIGMDHPDGGEDLLDGGLRFGAGDLAPFRTQPLLDDEVLVLRQDQAAQAYSLVRVCQASRKDVLRPFRSTHDHDLVNPVPSVRPAAATASTVRAINVSRASPAR
ncbi:hypothetical protein [Stenotrophomonas sp.]|uniref:hypothetical protein n=1 Tax=Stenotrophomonas sp. TaxID=69392 RepID=UPI0028B0366E|nr:hypothetical protein [Stenotrophomonas sp.]